MKNNHTFSLIKVTFRDSNSVILSPTSHLAEGWSGGAKVLGKLSVPGRPTSLNDSRARAYCACSRCGWGLFGHIYLFSFLSPSLWETARYRLKYCLKGPLNPKQPTNQPHLATEIQRENFLLLARSKFVSQFERASSSREANIKSHIWSILQN